MTDPDDIPPEYLDRIRDVCLALPEAYEEPAWAGTRWRIRQKTFAHVLVVDPGHQAAYARVVGSDEPACVLTFRSPGNEMAALVAGGYPFYKAAWGTDVVGMVLADDVDWEEVGELLTDSYCVLAPKRLAAQVCHNIRS